MFNLYVISVSGLREHLLYSFQDLLEGFVRYKEEAEKLGFTIHYVEDIDSKELIKQGRNIDGIFSMWGNGASSYRDEDFKQKKPFKFAVFLDDFHWWDKKGLDLRLFFFDRIDLIFLPYYRSIMKYEVYSEFRNKFVSLPWWSVDHCFSINSPWLKRKNKILFSGAHFEYYALREKILSSKHRFVEVLPTCGYSNFSHPHHGRAFLDYVSNFKGMIGTSASPGSPKYDKSIVHPLDYTLLKVFESLGCGCLSFLEKTEDFKELGFVEYKHYIPIDANNFKNQFLYLTHNVNVSRDIAKEGREFVRLQHSTKNRVISVLKTLQKKWLI